MDAIVYLGLLVGGVMLLVSLARLLPEIGVDNPLDLLASLVGRNPSGDIFGLIYRHIREGWPDTKAMAFLFYGGMLLMVGPVLSCWVIPGVIREFSR
jgi:uncharacterized membrane protein